jgi:hypothetical protein
MSLTGVGASEFADANSGPLTNFAKAEAVDSMTCIVRLLSAVVHLRLRFARDARLSQLAGVGYENRTEC